MAGFSVEEVVSLGDAIAGASFDDSEWPDGMVRIRSALGGATAYLGILDAGRGTGDRIYGDCTVEFNNAFLDPQFALGPKVSYRFNLDGDVVIDTGLKLEAVLDFDRSGDSLELAGTHAAIEASVGVTTLAGLHVGASLGYTGAAEDDLRTLTGKLSVRANLD